MVCINKNGESSGRYRYDDTYRDEFVNIVNIFVFGRLDELQNH